MVAAFRLGMRLSAALISKNVGLVELSPPKETKDMLADADRLQKVLDGSYATALRLSLEVHAGVHL